MADGHERPTDSGLRFVPSSVSPVSQAAPAAVVRGQNGISYLPQSTNTCLSCGHGRGPAVWVAPGYQGPKMKSYAWPQHACRVCTPPACFGYHAGQWQPWPCPEPPRFTPMPAESPAVDATEPGDLPTLAPTPDDEALRVPQTAPADEGLRLPSAPAPGPMPAPPQTAPMAPLPESSPALPAPTAEPEGESEVPPSASSPSDLSPTQSLPETADGPESSGESEPTVAPKD